MLKKYFCLNNPIVPLENISVALNRVLENLLKYSRTLGRKEIQGGAKSFEAIWTAGKKVSKVKVEAWGKVIIVSWLFVGIRLF